MKMRDSFSRVKLLHKAHDQKNKNLFARDKSDLQQKNLKVTQRLFQTSQGMKSLQAF